jgi:hypothetical protein
MDVDYRLIGSKGAHLQGIAQLPNRPVHRPQVGDLQA